MDQSTLKTYAQQARRDFITEVTDRAAFYGLTATGIKPVVEHGDVVLIGERAFPLEVAAKRKRLEERIKRDGFEQAMEAMAYTWFNRFAAIRYMELHGYLDHGYRVLSHPEDRKQPEILDHAADIALPGLNRDKAVELKLDGSKDEELYRLLLQAQCNALHRAMPFLFERIGDQAELLLPGNLLHNDSLIRQLVEGIDEHAWDEIEIIGWLYQFYISEKKDQVIGKVVQPEDIPAATQLFTPNWIVKYMVQNSLGAQWLATYPASLLKEQMDYYIEPAEQTDEVKAQLKAITPRTLNPEQLTLIDPACGSGHILVEAYDLLKAIYLERGYRRRDVPKLILEKNLFGLDIDERAAQLTGFSLMMKGRADDRRLFERGVKLNVTALLDSTEFGAERLAAGMKLADYGLQRGDLAELKQLFEHAKTFGSLIQVPEKLAKKLPALRKLSEATSLDLFVSDALKRLGPLVRQAGLLAAQYDAVVANPPYMGSKFYCTDLKRFINRSYEAGKSDLYAAFTLRNIQFVREHGHVGMITIPNWMFLSSFEHLRDAISDRAPIRNMVHIGRGVWGADFGSCSYILRRCTLSRLVATFLRLFDKQGSVSSNEELERRFHRNARFTLSNNEFKRIPGSPMAYWVSDRLRGVFEKGTPLEKLVDAKQGLATADNDQFLRRWHEVDQRKCGYGFECGDAAARSGKKWFPYNKGGEFRKWFGNQEFVVNWKYDGREIRGFGTENGGRPRSRAQNTEYYFRPSVTWSFVSSSYFGVRYSDPGALFDVGGSCAFPAEYDHLWVTGLLCSKQTFEFMRVMNPTLNFQVGNVGALPVLKREINQPKTEINDVVRTLIEYTRIDWNTYERSWEFQCSPILSASSERTPTLESSYSAWLTQNRETIAETRRLEEENNRLFIDAYGLKDELTPGVPIEQITLTVNPAYRYGGKLTEEEQWARFRENTMQELVSYAIGCMMGRYSLDEQGLIYAYSGNKSFDSNRYTTFTADGDGIVPITDGQWFDDDATHRLSEFISIAWDSAHLEDNLTFLADNLSPRKNQSSRQTIRGYFSDRFFKDHLQTYKNRPIYWLFSSGKSKAFQCLVYLHRYNESTLARIRTEYVVPLQGMMASRVRQLDGDIMAASSTAHRKRLEKERSTLVTQQSELLEFDEKLRHYADQRITLDLDDGVKMNYGKFGDLLAEVKKVTGGKAD